MSAVTVRVLDEHLAAVRAALRLHTPASPGPAHAVDGYQDAISKAPRLILVAHLAKLTATTALGPRRTAELAYLAATLRWAVEQAGYQVRPYDPLLDARRWRWQPAGMCGRPVWNGFTDSMRQGLLDGISDLAARREEEGR